MSARCAVPGCAARVRPGHLMCVPHWSDLPRALRRAVNRTWRRLGRVRTLEAALEYRGARDAAVVHFTGLPSPARGPGFAQAGGAAP